MSTSYLRVALGLAQSFGEVEAARLARAAAFRAAVDAALAIMPEERLVAEVVAEGSLRGAANPYGVLITRVRRAPEHVAEEARMSEELAEAARWRRVDKAVKRGETLRALVERGDLSELEAVEQLGSDFPDDADLLALAKAAVLGGQQ